MTEVTTGQVKGLFFHLVKAVGGVEAAGAYLGVSHQRVSALQNGNSADMPTLMQVLTLEAAAVQSIVLAPLSKAATGGLVGGDLGKETREATYAAVDLQRIAEGGADRKTLQAALLKLRREADEVQAALDAA